MHPKDATLNRKTKTEVLIQAINGFTDILKFMDVSTLETQVMSYSINL